MNRVFIGDCREIMKDLITQGVKVQMCVTSPPYWGLKDYGVDGQLGLEETPEAYVKKMVEVFGLVKELLADDGILWLNLGDSYAGSGAPMLSIMPTLVYRILLKGQGLHIGENLANQEIILLLEV